METTRYFLYPFLFKNCKVYYKLSKYFKTRLSGLCGLKAAMTNEGRNYAVTYEDSYNLPYSAKFAKKTKTCRSRSI